MNRSNEQTPQAKVAPETADQGVTRRSGLRNLRTLGVNASAVVLYFLLLDAAVETFTSGSPVRWWVAAIMITYFAGIALLWRRGHPVWQRVDWKGKATTSLFVFLGLLTITVWIPGGIANGVRMLGQATSTLLIVTTVMTVALSGMILTRPRYPHPAVKWAIATLAVYALIAFLWALPAGTLFSDLFRGESFWRWLPRWVQGAVIGAVVLVPAALLYQIIGGLLRTPGIELRKQGVQALALSMSLVMTIAGLKVPGGTAHVKISDRGRGMRRKSLDCLSLL